MEEKPAVVNGEFVTYSHLKTRKTFSIVIEFPEEQALQVLNTLGSPIGGNSKPVAVALLNDSVGHKLSSTDKTEGEKLRVRAVTLCKDEEFHNYIAGKVIRLPIDIITYNLFDSAKYYIYQECNISSRAELATNIEAQNKFKELLEKYKDWQAENNYADNLNRF